MSNVTAEAKPAAPTPAPKKKAGVGPMDVIKGLASLKLTVWLMGLSFLLVFFGTLAQIDHGIWTVVRDYFRSWVVFIPFNTILQFGQIFFGLPKEWTPGVAWRIGGAFPFPGGFTLATLLLANLLAAHLIRFKLSLNRVGILVLHAGLIVMLIGEIITGVYAVEGNMVIEEGESTNVVIENRVCELAVVDPSDEKTDTVVTVPRWMLRDKIGQKISHDGLPFDVVPLKYMANAKIERAGEKNLATEGKGLQIQAVEVGEVSGVAEKQTVDVPAVYVKLLKKGTDEVIGTYLFSITGMREQEVTAGGKSYDVSLRFKQTTRPFSLTLNKFTFDRYPGTDTPRNFASQVTLKDGEFGDNRDLEIRMNEPLRHRGETFYQADWNKETEKGTVLQVVRNPAWQFPYWSCAIVTLGLLIHFTVSLVGFLSKREA